MNQKVKFILGLLVLGLFLLGAYVLYHTLSKDVTPTENPANVEAPDFTVVDLDGNEVKRSDFLGKPMVINFWATWCPYCIEEMPVFDEVYADVKEDVIFLMVDVVDGVDETVEKASAYVEEQGFQFPVVYDTELKAARNFGIRGLPTTVFLDAEGNLISTKTGPITKERLLDEISKINP